MHVVVIGFGAAGSTAARFALSTNKQCSVTVLEKRRYGIYHPCSLPSVIAGDVPLNSIVEDAPTAPRLSLHTSTVVEEVDVGGRRVRARDLRSGEVVTIEYDALVLATGSEPSVPRELKIEDSDGVFTLKTIEDAEQILAAALKYDCAVVVGGSILGIEIAHALKRRSVRVSLIEKAPQLLPDKLDEEIAEQVEEHLVKEGVNVLLGEAVTEIRGDLGSVEVVTSMGKVLRTGFVVLATGVRPNNYLARQIGLELGERGGVKVDEMMRTSRDSIYAAGDLVEVKSFLTGKPTISPLASTAFLTGRVAGINAAGGDERFPGTLQNWVADLNVIKLGAVGLTESAALNKGLNPVSSTVTLVDRPPFHKGASITTVKLIACGESGRIVGLQAVGGERVVELLNTTALAIIRGMKVQELWHLEHAYTPTLNDVVHPLHAAARAIEKQLKKNTR